MAHSEVCPICHGKGKLYDYSGKEHVEEKCHGCGGRGWVEVRDEPAIQPSHCWPDTAKPYMERWHPYQPRWWC